MSKVDIVTVTYNSSKNLSIFFESLQRNINNIDTIYMVDNNSKDNTLQEINLNSKKYNISDKINIIKNESNFGYTFAVNQGLKATKNDLVLVLNNDLILKEGVLQVVTQDLLDSGADCMGVFGYNDVKKEYFSGFNYKDTSLSMVNFNTFSEEKFQLLLDNNIRFLPCDFPSGHFLLFRKIFFQKVGYYDEKLFFSGDETDFAIRSNKNNNVDNYVSVRATQMVDHITVANKSYSPIKNKYYIYGYNYLLLKHFKHKSKIKFWIKSILFFIRIIKDRPSKILNLSKFYIETLFELFFYKR